MDKDKQIQKDILEIIESYALNKSRIKHATADSKIILDLKLNSARIMDIIMDCEEKYDIEIEDTDVPKMVTIGDAVQIIKKYI